MMNTMRVWMGRMAKMTEASSGRSFCVTVHHLCQLLTLDCRRKAWLCVSAYLHKYMYVAIFVLFHATNIWHSY